MKKVAIIGSTGSIGRQTLNVIRRYPDEFKVVSLAGGINAELLKEQINEFKPLVATSSCSEKDFEGFSTSAQTCFGENAFTNAIISEADVVVVALVGFKGIIAVLDCIKKGKDIALANKESLVVGGEMVMRLAKDKGIKITPIDSEHSAIWQCLNYDYKKEFKKLILTCSGGAFRDYTKEQLVSAKASDALKHPNWDMGAKITIDCATLVNKGFEVIEARWLYDVDFSKIDVIIHKESIIHSMVEYNDASVISQMSYPTMEIPISLALSCPKRLDNGVKSLDFSALGKLTFDKPDKDRFPCLDLIISAGKQGGLYPAVANGANEQAVKYYLENRIGYMDIYQGIKGALDTFKGGKYSTYEELESANNFGASFIKNKFGV